MSALDEEKPLVIPHKAETGVVFDPDPRKATPIDTREENGWLVTKFTDGTYRKTRIPE